jgi:hypothetical protein
MAVERVTTSFTSVSWIPSEAIAGFMRLPIDAGIGRYDQAPPSRIDDIEAFVADGRCRFVNRLTAWAEIDGGRIVARGSSGGGLLAPTEVGPRRVSLAIPAVGFPEIRAIEADGDRSVTFTQTAGGRTGAPFPRRVGPSKRWKLTAPTAWTTLAITIAADGSTDRLVRGASPFPRHFFYDDTNTLVSKSATIDFERWTAAHHDEHTPWGDTDNEVTATATESELERVLSVLVMQSGRKPELRRFEPGDIVMRQGERATTMALVLDGLAEIEVDGRVVADSGPGTLLGERAFLEDGVRTSTVRAVTAMKVAEADPTMFAPDELDQLRELHRRELDDPPAGDAGTGG